MASLALLFHRKAPAMTLPLLLAAIACLILAVGVDGEYLLKTWNLLELFRSRYASLQACQLMAKFLRLNAYVMKKVD